MTATSGAETNGCITPKVQFWPINKEPQRQNKIAKHTTKSKTKTKGKLGHLCGAAASATRRVGDSAATGLLGALLPLLPLCCFYFFVLLLHKSDQGVTSSCQFLILHQRHLAAQTAVEECMVCEGDDLQRHHKVQVYWAEQGSQQVGVWRLRQQRSTVGARSPICRQGTVLTMPPVSS